MISSQPRAVDVGDAEVTVFEAQDRQHAGALLIDVREPEELEDGFVFGAVNVALAELSDELPLLPKDRDLLFICRSGKRSLHATELARAAGNARAFSVAGGMTAWSKSGLAVVR